MTRCEAITFKVVHEWREELIGRGFRSAPEVLALHHREPLLKYAFISDDEHFPRIKYIYADFSRGWAWLNNAAGHRLRTFEYAAAPPRRAKVENLKKTFKAINHEIQKMR